MSNEQTSPTSCGHGRRPWQAPPDCATVLPSEPEGKTRGQDQAPRQLYSISGRPLPPCRCLRSNSLDSARCSRYRRAVTRDTPHAEATSVAEAAGLCCRWRDTTSSVSALSPDGSVVPEALRNEANARSSSDCAATPPSACTCCR